MDVNLIYVAAVVLVFALAFSFRYLAKHYADSKVALVMLAVEKELSTWAKNQNASGAEKRKAAEQLIADKVYPFLPTYVKVFVTRDMLLAGIDKLYGEMLDFLDDGVLNNSIE